MEWEILLRVLVADNKLERTVTYTRNGYSSEDDSNFGPNWVAWLLVSCLNNVGKQNEDDS